ncbi:MAG: non-canonical purine NTP pyrophosphatase, RdgB/HAM1 family [Planctomycetaceae bacterium]|nr:RdgB/HAM1 family non-canonical purine NTP pyrophosphatase [Gemmataceae bacterium]PHX63808.1 MAG: non-canonical purine NTP pyrophosphatase, RdgB/HAM1 family [Planctomycetaceae bacterium]
MTDLVIGTKNKSKLKEIKEIYADLPFNCLDLGAFQGVSEVVEDGSSFAENATKKASGYALQVGKWVLAEDSGLVVPTLKGDPGIHSARYAGEHGCDAANNSKLLHELIKYPAENRDAYYICVACLADPQGKVMVLTEGKCHGRIIPEYLGEGGFGYDPLFLVLEYHQTFGELSSRVKHAISHRSKALAKLRPSLWQLLSNS